MYVVAFVIYKRFVWDGMEPLPAETLIRSKRQFILLASLCIVYRYIFWFCSRVICVCDGQCIIWPLNVLPAGSVKENVIKWCQPKSNYACNVCMCAVCVGWSKIQCWRRQNLHDERYLFGRVQQADVIWMRFCIYLMVSIRANAKTFACHSHFVCGYGQ